MAQVGFGLNFGIKEIHLFHNTFDLFLYISLCLKNALFRFMHGLCCVKVAEQAVDTGSFQCN
jgi:hypothetical protein